MNAFKRTIKKMILVSNRFLKNYKTFERLKIISINSHLSIRNIRSFSVIIIKKT